jgi:glycosyltransferase involved in cell wall biosynthesis
MTDSAAESTTSPLISVITATYNWSSVLRYAIQSVLWQTLQGFEMLIIGDGCTDDSAEVVASFQDPRLRWHNLPENSGHQSMPNNTRLAMARGKYVAYLGHDDLWYPTCAALQDTTPRGSRLRVSCTSDHWLAR